MNDKIIIPALVSWHYLDFPLIYPELSSKKRCRSIYCVKSCWDRWCITGRRSRNGFSSIMSRCIYIYWIYHTEFSLFVFHYLPVLCHNFAREDILFMTTNTKRLKTQGCYGVSKKSKSSINIDKKNTLSTSRILF